jgi:hypothetical protein
MAKALPVEHYRGVYRAHQSRAAGFGVTPKEFNARVTTGRASPSRWLNPSTAWGETPHEAVETALMSL